MTNDRFTAAIAAFPQMPDNSGVSIPVAGALLSRSIPSIWRDINAGRLEAFQIGSSRRVVTGSIRKVMAGGAS